MFIVTLTYIRPLEELDALMDAHVTWLKKHYESGLFVASGRQVPRKGGVILARSGDREALEAVLARDPQHDRAGRRSPEDALSRGSLRPRALLRVRRDASRSARPRDRAPAPSLSRASRRTGYVGSRPWSG